MPKKKSGTRGSPSGRLRIVAGKWRSRLLPVADLAGLRPTSERVRETLFNWLAPVIEGARCLDLFAGTGALGFEALSRGARSVTFVEQSIINSLYPASQINSAKIIKPKCITAAEQILISKQITQFTTINFQKQNIYASKLQEQRYKVHTFKIA